MRRILFWAYFLIFKQEIPGRTNLLLSFDMTRTARKTENLGDIHTHRHQGDLIRFYLFLEIRKVGLRVNLGVSVCPP
jgi:hypothetical protein